MQCHFHCCHNYNRLFYPTDSVLYKDTLGQDTENDLAKLEERKKKLSKCCFNCGDENCSIAACPHPKDPEAINKRKAEFLAATGGKMNRGVSTLYVHFLL